MVLSGAQAKAIQANWKTVEANSQKFGNDLFIRCALIPFICVKPGLLKIICTLSFSAEVYCYDILWSFPNRYITQNPGDQNIFVKFRDCPLGDLRSNAEFNKQSKMVIDALSKIVGSLDDLQLSCDFLRERVRTHAPRHITMAQFEVRGLFFSICIFSRILKKKILFNLKL